MTSNPTSVLVSSLASLRLTDFRSYARLDLSLDGRPVILFGANGAGKTNLLEAISLLSPGRGLRGARVDQLARAEQDIIAPAWGVNACLAEDTRLSVGSLPDHPRRRIVRIDGTSQPAARLADYLSVQWLTPAQDRLFTGPEGDRRKFLDRLVLAFSPDHGPLSSRFEKARTSRNRLLSDGINDDIWFEALEADLAHYGAQIAARRVTTVERLSGALDQRQGSVFPQAGLHITGCLEDRFQDGLSIADLETQYLKELARTRDRDQRAGRTLTGPHRSEVHVTHRAKSMPAALCSTGEQKALLIGLILAHARAQTDRAPILLLDEVAAHLDVVRRKALAEELIDLGLQVFMTGTDQSLFEHFTDHAQWFEVKDGQVITI